jgi:hypothetical protein
MESMDWYVDDPDGEWDDRMAQVGRRRAVDTQWL